MFSRRTTRTLVRKSIAKLPNHKRPNVFLSFFFLSFFLLLQMGASSKLCDSFTMVFAKWTVHQPITFSQLWSLMRWFKQVQTGHWRTVASLVSDAIFQKLTHVHKSLSNEDCWIRNTVVWIKTGRVFGVHCWLSVWRELGQWFFSRYFMHLLRKLMRIDLVLCDRWQTSAQTGTCF